ncbi:MAG: TetR/AcrR family transcriptional regulator [Candidatus Riflebacteria bacterium]|nr:TetR/AcrR family transcriptional regulator [Candidatus Riflebacteria bacterium]
MSREENNKIQRDKILKAALKIFAKKGYSETTTDDLAAAAKVGKGTLYRFFKNKQALFFTLIDIILEDLFGQTIEQSRTANNLEERVSKGIDVYANYFVKNKKSFSLILQNLGQIGTKNFAKLHEIFFSKLKMLEDNLGPKDEKKLVKPFPQEDMILCGVGLVNIFVVKWFFSRGSFDLSKKTEMLKEVLLRGIISQKG